jgi:hypothetical protein
MVSPRNPFYGLPAEHQRSSGEFIVFNSSTIALMAQARVRSVSDPLADTKT